MRLGRVNFGGIVKTICLDYVPEIEVGDYTVVHVGFALSKLDRESAEKTLEIFRQMGMLEEELAGEEEAFSRAAQMAPSPCPDGSCLVSAQVPEAGPGAPMPGVPVESGNPA